MKSCIILCGGLSQRMGKDKGSMFIQGKPMVLHVLEAVENIVDEVVLVLRDEKQVNAYKKILKSFEIDLNSNLKSNFKINIKICTDIIKDQGPLVGILTGLSRIKSDEALVLPCDSPFVSKSFVLKIFSFYDENKGEDGSRFDAVVPRWPDGRIEPLHSIYKKDNKEKIEKILKDDLRNVKSLIEMINVKFVAVESLDKTGKSFQNMNRMDDVKQDG
jgi:molybdenum cofactor guanylyltransferase